jgi:TetR/AcrR family acrAB operon transcriptional repressor
MTPIQSRGHAGAGGSDADREQRILDAAARLFVEQGFDKTTVEEIARGAGISKGAIYLHFRSKDALFEVLLAREMGRYGERWQERMEADPEGGTLGGLYRNILTSLHASPLMTAIFRQDRRIIGSYLQKPGNLFETREARGMRAEFVESLQAAGVVRRDVDPAVVGHVLDVLGYGLVRIGDVRDAGTFPPLESVLGGIADLLDRGLSPEGGADSEAGKAVIRKSMEASREYLEQVAGQGAGGVDEGSEPR